MNFFISIVSLLILLQTGSSFRPPSCRKHISINRIEMTLQSGDGQDNSPSSQPIAKNIDLVDTLSFPLAKEYHKFLIKYKILSGDDIDKITNLSSSNILNLSEDNNSVKIAKSRIDNYLIFEKNWNKINEVKKNSDKLIDFKVGINKYADSIDFDNNFKSKDLPDDLMKKQIKKNVKFSWKMIENRIKKPFDELSVANYLDKPRCVIEIIKGILNITDTKLDSKKPFKEDYIDWSSNGMTTMVKDQGQCGSCWAFSAVSTLESYMRIKNKSTEMLSEQELVDCSKEDYGCGGGFMDTAYDYVIDNNGLHSIVDYPYVGRDGECKADCCKEYNDFIDKNKNMEVETIKKLSSVESKDTLLVEEEKEKNVKLHRRVPGSRFSEYRFFYPESVEDIKKSLKNGPIAIALDANSFFFRFYESGVIDLPSDYSYGLNHAVMLVGYGKDKGGEHWIIQNSWGPGWGDKGFVRLRIREGEGTLLCQIYGVYPYK